MKAVQTENTTTSNEIKEIKNSVIDIQKVSKKLSKDSENVVKSTKETITSTFNI
jgi:hypothetical protein